MTEYALNFRDIFKHYEKKPVLRGINLGVRTGECFGLIGMNGAGKTTLIKCLLDFSAPDSGTIDILNLSHRLTPARKPLAYLPERFMPPHYLTGLDFIKYTLQLQAIEYDPQATTHQLAALDFDPAALNKPVRVYSKGMTQKLGLIACLLAGKQLFVLDEPMSGLDPKARVLLKQCLRDLHAAGATLFFSTHALTDVLEICDRMAILHEGQVKFVGSPAQCCQQYASDTLEQAYLQCIM
ncbi:ABC transporter ATP-binding protein [Ampullimonas aquatilis]|uniref:ABC transporter ATP-binding protein n=1 Tax=Ampullimonas aquatilis TaxID=1341549 RepID=UPI003C7383E0